MRRSITTLLVLLLLSTALYGVDFSYDLSLISARDESNGYDLTLGSEIIVKNFEASLLYMKEAGQVTLNYETTAKKEWKYAKITTNRTYIEDKVNKIYLEAVGKYPVKNKDFGFLILKYISVGNWEAGYRQTWSGERMIPKSNIVLGKSLNRKVELFFAPAELSYSFYYTSSDFEQWQEETNAKFEVWLLSYLSVYFRLEQKESWLRLANGLRIKL